MLHEVFGIGEHPWPDDMRDANWLETYLVSGSDAERYDLIQLMSPEQRAAHGIDPGGEVFPDFTQYNTRFDDPEGQQSRGHDPGFRPSEGELFRPLLGYEIDEKANTSREILGFDEPLPEEWLQYA